MIELTICTGAFNGYGKHLLRFCKWLADMEPQPTAAIVALGRQHGLRNLAECQAIYPIKPVYIDGANIGRLHNAAIGAAQTEYVWWVDIDDKPLRKAVAEFSKYDADYIAPAWFTKGLDQERMIHYPTMPKQLHSGGFISHGAYRKKFWETTPYPNNMYPRYGFIADLVEQGAKFTATKKACYTYHRRMDGLNQSIIRVDKVEGAKARKQKRQMEHRLRRYYAKSK